MDDTFYLSNIVPQNLDNNAGFWNLFEMYCRDLTKKFSDVFVISGPVFLPSEENGKRYMKYEVCCHCFSGNFSISAMSPP